MKVVMIRKLETGIMKILGAPLTQSLIQGIDFGQFPQSRSFVVGLQVGF